MFPTHIIYLLIEICSVFASVDVGEHLSQQMGAWRLAVAVPVVHACATAGCGPPGDGAPGARPAPPRGVRVVRGRAGGLPAGLRQLGELQGEGPSVPPGGAAPGEEERRRRRWRVGGVMGARRVGQERLLLGGVHVGVGGAAAVHAQAAPDQRGPAKTITPPAKAV